MDRGSMSAVYFERLKDDATRGKKKRPELLDVYNRAKMQYIPLSSEIHGF
jgi:hypothetical protein